MLTQILSDLREGKALTLNSRPNQYNEEITTEELSFSGGEWHISELCSSSKDYGLGTCNCHSHDPWYTYKISRECTLTRIRHYIQRQQADEARRRAEIAWLDQAIAELTEQSA